MTALFPVWTLVLAAALLLKAPAGAQAWGKPLAPSPDEIRALRAVRGKLPGEIIFSSRRDGIWRLFRIRPDGTGLVRLSTGPGNHTRPFLVRGGQKLIYQNDVSGQIQIWRANPDLTGARPLSPPGRREFFQEMTGDGRFMLVASTTQSVDNYFLRDLVSGQETRLRFPSHFKKGELYARISPDGGRVAFQFKPDGGGQPGRGMYVMDLGPGGLGRNARRIQDGCFMHWRRDSRAFLTSSHFLLRGIPGTHVWELGLHKALRKVVGGLAWNYFAVYGPQERWLAWGASPLTSHHHQSGRYELRVKPLDRGHPLRLTFHSAPDIEPAWRAQVSRAPRRQAWLYYQAEDFRMAHAQTVAFPGAWGSKATLARAGSGNKASVFHGQYDKLPPGEYAAFFRLRAKNHLRAGVIATIDVTSKSGRESLARRDVSLGELKPHAWTEIPLQFSSRTLLHDLEVRLVFHPGKADLYLDGVRLGPAPPADWHRGWLR